MKQTLDNYRRPPDFLNRLPGHIISVQLVPIMFGASLSKPFVLQKLCKKPLNFYLLCASSVSEHRYAYCRQSFLIENQRFSLKELYLSDIYIYILYCTLISLTAYIYTNKQFVFGNGNHQE